MSLRIDTAEWIAGALVLGDVGGGVLAESLIAGGFLADDVTLPADNGKEICGRVTVWPAGLSLTTFEDGGVIASGADGTYVAQYQLYVDYVATGPATALSFTFGAASGALAAAAWTEGAEVFAVTGTPAAPGEGGALIAVCIATIMSDRPINLQAPMSSAAINLIVSF